VTGGERDARVDDYIAGRAPFARPILDWLRAQIHAARPGLDETIKWGMPFFLHDGRPLAHMAGFKAHAAFGFWRNGAAIEAAAGAMGQFGRLTTFADLPAPDAFAALVRKAVAAADARPASAGPARPRAAVPVPADLLAALPGHAAAQATWQALPAGARREYAAWIDGAKRSATRTRRLATTLAQLAEGKRLDWKYERGDRE
jgi:uncharacterized protein YdeI (YjbR/CyaY-like superfamily)